jgi:hypothetical protein
MTLLAGWWGRNAGANSHIKPSKTERAGSGEGGGGNPVQNEPPFSLLLPPEHRSKTCTPYGEDRT